MPSLTVQFADAVAAAGSGSVDVESNSVTNDAAGNVYVTGSLQGTADFDPGAGVVNLTSAGGRDVFVAKYTSAGALVWVKDLRGADPSSVGQGTAIALDAQGNIVLTGTFTGTTNFDPAAASPGATFSAPGRNDVFIAKYDPSGTLIWARDVVGTSGTIDEGYTLALDGMGDVFAGGSFQSAATFGATVLSASGSFEGFVTMLSPSGQFLWAKATLGSGASVAQTSGLAVDGAGNVLSTGFFAGTVDFDPGTGVLNLTSAGSRDIFVQKLDASGNLVWAESFGSPDIDQGNAIAADSAGNVYVTGMVSGTVDFDPGPGVANLTAGGFFDAFLLKLTAAGQYVWAKDFTETGFNAAQPTGVGLDGSGHVFVTGHFQGTIALDPSAVLTSAGAFDVFVGEYTTAGAYVAGQSLGGANTDYEFGVGVNASGLVAIAGRYTGPASFGSITLPAQPGKCIFIAQLSSAPPPPVLPPAPSAPALEAQSDTGLSSTDRITNARSLTFDETGASSASYVIQLLRDGAVVASRVGNGPITDAGPVPDGAHLYTARQTDGSGNTSPSSASTTVTVDTAAPATPGALSLLPADDSGVKNDGITNVTQPRLIGQIDPLTRARLLDVSGAVLATTIAAADGSVTLSPPTPLSDGTYSYRIFEEDVAGNFSPASASFSLTIDATAPPAPSTPALLAADDSGIVGDGITNVRQPRLSGTVAAGVTVQLLNAAGTVIGSATSSGGSYTIAPSTVLADGVYALHVLAIDVAGNSSASSGLVSLTIDATSPAAPSTPSLVPSGPDPTSGVTSLRQPNLVGTAEPNATIQLSSAAGNVIGTTTATASGTYSVSPSGPLADGTYALQARAIDAAGNVSAPSGTYSLTIQTGVVLPLTPSVPVLSSGDDTGVKGDGITSVRQPHLTGTGSPGTTVRLVTPSGTLVGSGTVATGGGYSILVSSPLADGSYSIQARTVDASGNQSAPSATLTLTIDGTAPAARQAPILLASDDTGVKGDGITTTRSVHIIGTAEPGSTVQLSSGGATVLATAVAAADGSVSFGPIPPLAIGSYSFTLRATDVAGNIGNPSSALSLTIRDAALVDLDGDGKSDVAIYRRTTSQWISQPTSGGSSFISTYGTANLVDIPVPGDYDGTGKTELAVFRPSTAKWSIQGPTGQRVVTFGATNLFDIPVPGDYDGVGYTEPAVFRPSTAQWIVLGPNGGHVLGTFGATNLLDIPVPGDYDGVGHTEMAVFRPSTAQWFILGPSGGRLAGTFGATNLLDIPVPGDYDGLGRAEMAVFRPGTGQWFVLSPSGGRLLANLGATGLADLPLEASIASLKSLGTVGGIRITSLSHSSVATPQAQAVGSSSSAQGSGAVRIAVAKATGKPLATSKTTRRSATLDAAIDSLISERA